MRQVMVGGASLVYNPSQIMAAPGDMVKFTFMETNHTVTQSSFAKPCVKLAAMPGMPAPADSGFMPNKNNTVNPAPTFEYKVTTTDPTCKSPSAS
jgi:plastocyanin